MLLNFLIPGVVFAAFAAGFHYLGREGKRASVAGGLIIASVVAVATQVVTGQWPFNGVVKPEPEPFSAIIPRAVKEQLIGPLRLSEDRSPEEERLMAEGFISVVVRRGLTDEPEGGSSFLTVLKAFPRLFDHGRNDDFIDIALSHHIRLNHANTIKGILDIHPAWRTRQLPSIEPAKTINSIGKVSLPAQVERVPIEELARRSNALDVLRLLNAEGPQATSRSNSSPALSTSTMSESNMGEMQARSIAFDEFRKAVLTADMSKIEAILKNATPGVLMSAKEDGTNNTILHAVLSPRILWDQSRVFTIVSMVLAKCPQIALEQNSAGDLPADLANAWKILDSAYETQANQVVELLKTKSRPAPAPSQDRQTNALPPNPTSSRGGLLR